MKVQIDLAQKTISTDEDINLGDFINNLAKLFPEEQWREYTLKRGNINWNQGLTIPPVYYPPAQPYIYGSGTGTPLTNNAGLLTNTVASSVYNVELVEKKQF